MNRIPSAGRWETWNPDSRQHPTDALAKWETKTKAKVDWQESSYRRPKNEIIHKVVPYREFILSSGLHVT
ncbi:hypothetical protein RHS03_07392, partial [Rhizoctonia solani]|uniref:Uncharacterized protein n=1 Tax=Rhizoctonia solani TaxID=456999 RepID=A0A8H7IAS8_9AGAM